MNIKESAFRFFAITAIVLVSASAYAGGKPSGPNGGRILNTQPRAEFFVNESRRVQITFLDEANNPVAPTEQVVTVTAGERASPVTMKFVKSGNAFVSDIALPPGNNVPAVVQIKATEAARTSIARFNVDFATCPECGSAEYACACH